MLSKTLLCTSCSCTMVAKTRVSMASGTGPVGPAMAGPTIHASLVWVRAIL